MIIFLMRLIFSWEQCANFYPKYFECVADQCIIGEITMAKCKIIKRMKCEGSRTINASFPCYYCWQLPISNRRCVFPNQCQSVSRPIVSSCSTVSTSECLGNRAFSTLEYCKSKSGYSKTVALSFSILLGGFGADRFYLGYMTLGTIKMFTFGGLSLWSIIDVILISCDVLRPFDGSFYE